MSDFRTTSIQPSQVNAKSAVTPDTTTTTKRKGIMTTSDGYIEPMPTGGSSRSHLASRNPYRGDDDLFPPPRPGLSRNPYTGSISSIPRRKPLPPSREDSYSSSREDIYSASPPLFPPPHLPPRPDTTPLQQSSSHQYHQTYYHQQQRPGLPPRPHTLDEVPSHAAAQTAQTRTMTPPPALPPRPREAGFFAFRRRLSQISHTGEGQIMQLPPRRLLTTDDIPVNSVGYTRNPEKVIAYLIPLPVPMHKGQPMKVPQVSVFLPSKISDLP